MRCIEEMNCREKRHEAKEVLTVKCIEKASFKVAVKSGAFPGAVDGDENKECADKPLTQDSIVCPDRDDIWTQMLR